MRRWLTRLTSAGLAVGAMILSNTTCRAEVDFLAQFFGQFSAAVESSQQVKSSRQVKATPTQPQYRPRKRISARVSKRPRVYIVTPRSYSRPGQTFCVRTCDGRFFPVAAGDDQTKGVACNDLCPASETSIYYGSTINDAVGENGRRYTELPNAFKFRSELVAGCTCNGSATGLASMKVENDPTLRKGDIVAREDGLVVARRSHRHGPSFAFSPVSAEIRAKFQRPPVVAFE